MRCSWGTCNTDYRYPERCVGIKFIPFVKPPKTKPWNQSEKCLRWIKACGRPHEQLNINKVNKNHYICSKTSTTSRVSDEPHTGNSSSNVQLNSEQTSTGTSEQTEESHCMNGLTNKQLNSQVE